MAQVQGSRVKVEKYRIFVLGFCPPNIETGVLQAWGFENLVVYGNRCWRVSTKVLGGANQASPIMQSFVSCLKTKILTIRNRILFRVLTIFEVLGRRVRGRLFGGGRISGRQTDKATSRTRYRNRNCANAYSCWCCSPIETCCNA